ncbi:NepR family anti-sigma factor [Sphingobium aromaticiconvertens]|uniref:NepR family anti-sigma factor n=1 Tax=Sphingobium aromaticiconvertens TaxID=365341 RepID=UPI003018EE4F
MTKPDVKSAGARKRPAAAGKKPSTEDSHVGQVLRTVYQRTVDEAIPSEMLDLLSKLG